MTRDDVIRLALKAGFGPITASTWDVFLENFAALVAAHSLVEPCCQQFDTCQKVCMPRAGAAEREACVKVVWNMAWSDEEAFHICQAIRERGEK